MNASGVGPETVYFNAGSTYTVTNLTFNGSSGHSITLRSTNSGQPWYLNNTGTSNGSYVDVKDSDARLGKLINAPTSGTDSGNNKNWNLGTAGQLRTWLGSQNNDWSNGRNWDFGMPAPQDSALIVTTATVMPTLTANVSLSTLTINSGTATVTLNGFGVTLSSFTNAGNLLLTGNEIVTSAPNSLAGSSVTYTGAGTGLVFSTWTYRNLVINGTGGNFNSPATGSQNIGETFTVVAGTFTQNTLPVTVNTYQQTGGVFLGGGANMTLASNFTLGAGATFYAPTQNMNFNGGNFTNSGIFYPQTGNVNFNTNITLTGQTTFYNFTSGPAAITLTFAQGSTQTINGNFTIAGQNGSNLMALRSTSPGNQFYLYSSGLDSILDVDVRDSYATGNVLASPTPSTTTGNTNNWVILQPATQASGFGTTDTSPQSRIVQNPAGIWIFFSQGGNFMYSSSVDGNTWSNPSKVFGASPVAGKGSIYYDSVSSAVYVAATQNIGRGSAGNSPSANNIWLTSATLNASSVKPNFVTFATPKALDMLYPLGGAGQDYTILGNGEVGLGIGGDGNAWLITESCLDGGNINYHYNVARFFTTTLNRISAVTQTISDSSNTVTTPFLGGGPMVVPYNNTGDMMLLYTHDGKTATPGIYYSKADGGTNNIHTQTSLSINTVNDDTHSITAVYDSANTALRFAAVDAGGNLQYMQYSAGAWSAKNLIDSPAQTPSMGLSSGSGVPKLYVVYQEAGGLNIDYAVAPITTAVSSPWTITAPWELVTNGSVAYPHITDQNTLPVPPRVIWSDNSPIVYFGTLYLNSAPTLTNISPASAPYTNNPFDVTLTGTNFGASNSDYGGGTQATVLWKGGSQNNFAFQAINLTSTTYVNGTTLRATMQVTNTVGQFDALPAISTSNPQFQFQVTNPDGQQTIVSTNTVMIPTPKLSIATAVSATGNSLGIQAASDIDLTGINFQGWNVNVSTGQPSITLVGGGVTVTSVTYVSATQANASVIITTNAPAGYQTITLVNPDGQSTNILISSFTVTIPTASVILANSLPNGVATVGSPLANYAQTISTFTGAAGVNLGGGIGGALTNVQVMLLEQNTTNYWGGTSFNLHNSPTWNPALGTNTWTYYSNQFAGIFGNPANHQHIYTIWARGLSSDGGTGLTTSSYTFTLDNKAPGVEGTLDITSPAANTRFSNVNSIGGDVEDPTSGVLAGTVTLRIIDTGYIGGGPNLYWNGSVFTSATTNYVQLNSIDQPANLPPNNSIATNWSYTGILNTNFTDGHIYQLQAQVADAVGNLSAWLPGTVYAFTYVTSAPTTTLVSPLPDLTASTTNTYMTEPLSSISGTSFDATDNLVNVKLKIKDITSGSAYLLPSCTDFVTVDPGWINTSNSSNLLLLSGSWSLTISTAVWTDGHIYEIYAQGDNGAVTDVSGTPPNLKGRFRFETDKPRSVITNPPSNGSILAYEKVSSMTGTSTDITLGYPQDSGINKGQMAVFDAGSGNNTWYDPAHDKFDSPSQLWADCTSTATFISSASWVNTIIPTHFTNGDTYTIYARAIDNAGNIGDATAGFTFMYSVSSPTVITTAPVSGAYNQKVLDYYGTISQAPSGITSLQIRLSRNSDGLVWLGHISQWQTDPGVNNLPFASPASLGNGFFNWSYHVAASDANNFYNTISDTYTITLYAFDNTVDVQHSSSSVPVSYVYEVLPPSSTVQSPAQGVQYNVTTNALTLLTGSTTDQWQGLGTGISKVWVQIQYYGTDGVAGNGDDQYWNGTSWVSTPAFSTATLTSERDRLVYAIQCEQLVHGGFRSIPRDVAGL